MAGGAQAASFDLVVNHNAIPPSATGLAGGDFSYEPIVFLNTDNVTAAGVTLTQVLPEGITLNSIEGASCNNAAMPFVTTAANRTIACDLADITAAGQSNGITVKFNVTIPEVGTDWQALASAQPAASDSDTDTGNNLNIGRNITTTTAADLGLELNGPAGGTATQHVPFNYVAKVTNHGPSAIPADGKVTVKFTVPTSTSVSGAGGGGSGWDCSPNNGNAGQELFCSHSGPVARNAVLNDLIIPVTSTATGEVELAATVQGYGPSDTEFSDAVLANNTDEAKVTLGVNTDVDVTLSKTASPSTFDVKRSDNAVTYTLIPKRTAGTGAASSVTVTDTLPTGVTFASFGTHTGWNCAHTAPQISCEFTGSTPNAGANYPAIEVDTTVDGTTATSFSNTGTVTFDGYSNTATTTITGSNAINLSLAKTRSQSPIKAGETFSWTLSVENEGTLDVLNGQTITLVDQVPEGINVTNAAGTDWTCDPSSIIGPGNISCTYNAGLTAGSTAPSVTLDAIGTFSGTDTHIGFNNVASITGVNGRDPVGSWPTDNSYVAVSEHQVDLSIVKAANHATRITGEEVTYTITVKNEDTTNSSTGIVVEDTITNLVNSSHGCTVNSSGTGCEPNTGTWPNGGLLSATSSPSGSCSISGNKDSVSRKVTCTGIELDAQQVATVTIKAVHFAEDGATNTTVTNQARVSSTQVEMPGATSKDSNEVEVVVSPLADLQVTKVPTPDPAAIGEPITYTLHVYNAGPSKAANVRLEDLLPANAHWIDGGLDVSGASCVDEDTSQAMADDAQGKTLTCAWSNQLNANSQVALKYELRSVPNANVDDELINTVAVTTATPESDYDNNSAEAKVTLKQAELDVLINMEHSNDGILLGEETEYTITVTNNGPSYATDVKMTDVFPSTLEIGGDVYPSTAIFSYQGLTALQLGTLDGGGIFTATSDLLPSAGSLCQQPTVDTSAELAPATPLTLECLFAKMAPQESVVIKFKMKAEGLPEGRNTGTIFHNAKVEIFEEEWLADGSDVTANNSTGDRTSTRRSADTPTPEVADLGLTKAASTQIGDDPLLAGEALTYTIVVTNHGPANSTLGIVSDVLPAGLNFVDAAGCDYDAASREVSCAVGALAVDAEKVFTINTTITDPYRGSARLKNTACVTAEGDPNPNNNCDADETPVVPPAAPVPVNNPLALLALILGVGWIARRYQMRKHA